MHKTVLTILFKDLLLLEVLNVPEVLESSSLPLSYALGLPYICAFVENRSSLYVRI